MPFKAGNQLAKGHGRPKKDTQKTLWLLQSLSESGVDLQALLSKSLLKASKGDRQAMDFAHLLTKLLPYVAQAPKNEQGTTHIDTLVINRYDGKEKTFISPPVDTVAEGDERLKESRLDALAPDPPLSDGEKPDTPAV